MVSLYLLLIEILEECETKIFLTFHLIRIQGTEVFMRICSRSLLNNQELSQFVPPTMLLGRDGNRIFEEQVFCLLESRYISLSVMSLTVNFMIKS